jgi:hypothetical protein
MRIEVDLLGIVNENVTVGAPLQTKYILRASIEQLALWLVYDRKGNGKNSPFKIADHSTIRIDEEIQRGKDGQGFLLQNPKKIMEIANTLLTPSSELVPRLYLGSLTWNVRPTAKGSKTTFEILKTEVQGKQPRWRLAFDTDAIYLTDSAHRHLGLVEAHRQFLQNPQKYPSFSPKYEFSIELYTLDKMREKELFSELNSKQKKISAAKQKEMDVSSPIGALKDAIQDYDRASRGFFTDNIEVSSNQNDKHTLMTMSVFVSSIGEMFSSKEIKAAREDEEKRAEMSEYYCEFFYELADTIIVRADFGDGEKEYHPFRNLYNEYIKPAVDNFNTDSPAMSEEALQSARDRATQENSRLRKVDVCNHNSFIKAFSRLGGYIRHMENWRDVITRLQHRLNIAQEGKLFQKSNPDLLKPMSSGVSIATLNEDGTINVQVQTKTINTTYDYFMQILGLNRQSLIQMKDHESDEIVSAADNQNLATKYLEESESFCTVYGIFYLPSSFSDINESSVRLDVDGDTQFKEITRKGKAQGYSPTKVEIDKNYIDSDYQDIKRWRAIFEIKLPAADKLKQNSAKIELSLIHQSFSDLDGTEKITVEATVKKQTNA